MLALHVPRELAATRLDDVSARQLDALYAHLLVNGRRDGRGGLAPRTVRYLHTILQKSFSDALRRGVIGVNPALAADPPSARASRSPVFPVWSPTQLRQFLLAARTDHYFPAFHLAASTGLRRGELLGLRWCDLNLEAGYLQVVQTLVQVDHRVQVGMPKSDSSRRRVELDRRTVEVLSAHRAAQTLRLHATEHRLEATDFVFTTLSGRRVHPTVFTYYFQRCVRASGLPRIRLHDLRHSHATHALQAGVNPKVVSERLGHSSVMVTLDIYSHVSPSMQRDAAEAVAALVAG